MSVNCCPTWLKTRSFYVADRLLTHMKRPLAHHHPDSGQLFHEQSAWWQSEGLAALTDKVERPPGPQVLVLLEIAPWHRPTRPEQYASSMACLAGVKQLVQQGRCRSHNLDDARTHAAAGRARWLMPSSAFFSMRGRTVELSVVQNSMRWMRRPLDVVSSMSSEKEKLVAALNSSFLYARSPTARCYPGRAAQCHMV